jgi:hypothetical protein
MLPPVRLRLGLKRHGGLFSRCGHGDRLGGGFGRFATAPDDGGLDPSFFDTGPLFAENGRFDAGDRVVVERTHVAADGDVHFCSLSISALLVRLSSLASS